MRAKVKISIIFTIICFVMFLMGCSEKEIKEQVVGTYIGEFGDCFTLFEDGSAEHFYYYDYEEVDSNCKWSVKKNRVTIYINNYKYDVFADVKSADSPVILKSNSVKWNDQEFKKLTSSAKKHSYSDYIDIIADELGEEFFEYDEDSDVSGNNI